MHVRIRHGSIAAAALLVVGATAFAQPLVETFEGITAVSPDVTGITTIPGTPNAPVWLDEYGTAGVNASGFPDCILGVDGLGPAPNSAFPYANTGDDQYLRWTNESDQWIQLDWGSVSSTAAGSGPIIQIAFACRVQLDPDLADNNLDIMVVSSPLPAGLQFSLNTASGNLRMTTANGYDGLVIAPGAFDPSNVDNWGDGQWRVVIGRLVPDRLEDPDPTPGDGSATWWEMDPVTGTITPLGSSTGLLQPNLGGDVNFIGLGASIGVGDFSNECIFDLDHLSFYPVADPAYDTEAEFLAAVVADMSNAAPTPINGDADNDGDIDVADATLVYNVAATIEAPAAITGDGDVVAPVGITAADADAIVQFLVNATPFPP